MEWAIEEACKTGLDVGSTMCIGPDGDLHGVTTSECAVRMAKAGTMLIPVVITHNRNSGNVYNSIVGNNL